MFNFSEKVKTNITSRNFNKRLIKNTILSTLFNNFFLIYPYYLITSYY